jgi:lipoprotein-anchoring transpeptidase ErfK/SrfK
MKRLFKCALALACASLALCHPTPKTLHAAETTDAIATPEITQLMALSKNSFSIRWNLIDGADGYIVYQNVDGKWKRLKTIAARETNHYTIKNLSYKKTYTFAIRAYRDAADGTIQRSARSEPYTEKLSFKSTYVDGNRLYYDASGDLITNVEGIIGSRSNYTIEVNRTTNTVTVYTADTKKKGCRIPVRSFLCSTGLDTPTGTYKTSDKYRWRALFHNVYGQWCTRITGHILFHSVYYTTNGDANTLDVTEYNKLGTAASAGCIRLSSADTKWIYDNCATKTKVTLYDDAEPGPLGYPEALVLESSHTWDPTDPKMKYLCKENGCHRE